MDKKINNNNNNNNIKNNNNINKNDNCNQNNVQLERNQKIINNMDINNNTNNKNNHNHITTTSPKLAGGKLVRLNIPPPPSPPPSKTIPDKVINNSDVYNLLSQNQNNPIYNNNNNNKEESIQLKHYASSFEPINVLKNINIISSNNIDNNHNNNHNNDNDNNKPIELVNRVYNSQDMISTHTSSNLNIFTFNQNDQDNQYKILSPGILRRPIYFKFKQQKKSEKYKSFILHFDFNFRLLKIIRKGKSIKTIPFTSFDKSIPSSYIDNFLSFRTKEFKSYDFYFSSKIERNEMDTLINLIISEPLHFKCPENIIIFHQGYIHKRGKIKWAKRWFELHHNQILCFKKKTSEYPVNAIPISGLKIKIFDNNGIIVRNDNRTFYFKAGNEKQRDEIYNKLTSLGINKRRKSIFNERKKSLQLNIIHNPNQKYYPSKFKDLHKLFQQPSISLKDIHLKNSVNLQDSSIDTNSSGSSNSNFYNYPSVNPTNPSNSFIESQVEIRPFKAKQNKKKRMISRQSVQDLIKKFNSINDSMSINNPYYLNNNEIYMKLIHRIDVLNETCDEIIDFLKTNKEEIPRSVLNNLLMIFQDSQFESNPSPQIYIANTPNQFLNNNSNNSRKNSGNSNNNSFINGTCYSPGLNSFKLDNNSNNNSNQPSPILYSQQYHQQQSQNIKKVNEFSGYDNEENENAEEEGDEEEEEINSIKEFEQLSSSDEEEHVEDIDFNYEENNSSGSSLSSSYDDGINNNNQDFGGISIKDNNNYFTIRASVPYETDSVIENDNIENQQSFKKESTSGSTTPEHLKSLSSSQHQQQNTTVYTTTTTTTTTTSTKINKNDEKKKNQNFLKIDKKQPSQEEEEPQSIPESESIFNSTSTATSLISPRNFNLSPKIISTTILNKSIDSQNKNSNNRENNTSGNLNKSLDMRRYSRDLIPTKITT